MAIAKKGWHTLMSAEENITFKKQKDHRGQDTWAVFRGEAYVGDLMFNFVMDLIFVPTQSYVILHIHHLAQIIKFMAEQEEKVLQPGTPHDKIHHVKKREEDTTSD